MFAFLRAQKDCAPRIPAFHARALGNPISEKSDLGGIGFPSSRARETRKWFAHRGRARAEPRKIEIRKCLRARIVCARSISEFHAREFGNPISEKSDPVWALASGCRPPQVRNALCQRCVGHGRSRVIARALLPMAMHDPHAHCRHATRGCQRTARAPQTHCLPVYAHARTPLRTCRRRETGFPGDRISDRARAKRGNSCRT